MIFGMYAFPTMDGVHVVAKISRPTQSRVVYFCILMGNCNTNELKAEQKIRTVSFED